MADAGELVSSFSTSSWSEWEGINVDENEDKDTIGDPFESQPTQDDTLKDNDEKQTSRDDNWVAFGGEEGEKETKEGFVDTSSVLKTCFELPEESNQDTLCLQRTGPLTVETKFLHTLHKSTVSLDLSSWSHSLIKDHFFLLLLSATESSDKTTEHSYSSNTLIELDSNDEYITFDWSQPTKNGQGGGDSEDEGVAYSPDLMQGLLRPVNGLDSPVEFEFDRDKATLGLSLLSCQELILMRDEMSSKVNKQSDELVTLLQSRDIIIRETDAKNKFIAALLKVQDHKQSSSMSNSNSSSNLLSLSYNGGIERRKSREEEEREGERKRKGEEGARDKKRREERGLDKIREDGPEEIKERREKGGDKREQDKRPNRQRSRSFSYNISQNFTRSLSLAWSRSKSSRMSVDERNSEAYLHIVIPYTPLKGTESYSVPLLKQWIKILKAMADRNPNLPNLISSYLQTEVLNDTT